MDKTYVEQTAEQGQLMMEFVEAMTKITVDLWAERVGGPRVIDHESDSTYYRRVARWLLDKLRGGE